MTDFSAWSHSASLTITGSTDGALTDYPVPVTVAYQSFMRSDFGDIRFALSDGTELSYSLESYTASSSAIFLVKVPNLPASPSTVTITIYAGNSSVTTTSNPAVVYLVYNLMNSMSGWTIVNGTWTSDGSCIQAGSGVKANIKTPFSDDGTSKIFKFKIQRTTGSNWGGVEIRSPNTDYGNYGVTGQGYEQGYLFLIYSDHVAYFIPSAGVLGTQQATANYSFGTSVNEIQITAIQTGTTLHLIFYANGTKLLDISGGVSYASGAVIRFLSYDPDKFNGLKVLQTTANPPSTGTLGDWTENSLIISTPPIQSILTVNTPQITIGGGIRITTPPIGLTSSINTPTPRAIPTSPPITAVSSIIPPVIAFLMEVKAGVTYNPDAINDLKEDGIPCNISFNVTIGGQQYE